MGRRRRRRRGREREREREKEESEALLSLYSDMGSLYREESRSVRAAAQSRG